MHKSTYTHTYSDGSKADEYVLQTSHGIVTIDPEGGYVTSWKVKHPHSHEYFDVLYRGSTKKRSGIPILFPYFGKSSKTRQHGFGRDSTWKVEHVSATSLQMNLSSYHIPSDAKQEYPYSFEAALTISLHENGAMEYGLVVKNIDSKDLPISPGIHPYWDIEHEEKKHIKVSGLSGFDASAIDWDNNPPDDRFTFDKSAALHFPDRTIDIKDISANGSKITQVAVWSQAINKPDFNFVCFEPVCGLDYAIDNNPILVSPNSLWEMKLKFSVEFAAV